VTIPASLALRQALVSQLIGDAGVAALVAARVYDHTPDREILPYISLRAASVAWDTSTEYGKEHAVEINVWSRQEGRKEAETILHAIETALRSVAPAVLTDHRLVNMHFETADVLREESGQTYFGYARLRAVTEEL